MSVDITSLADEMKMVRVVLSCETKEHYQSALEMARLFAAKYDDGAYVSILLRELKKFDLGEVKLEQHGA